MNNTEKIVPRIVESEIMKWLDAPEIIAVRGPRQCGKTTLLNRIINILEEKKVSKEKIHFISFEDDIEKGKFEKNPKEYLEFYTGEDKEKHYFFLDEVQYIKEAGKILKLIYDSKKDIKIVITGSSTLDLNEIGSYLVGRVLFFELRPFNFEEFLNSKNEKILNYYKKNKFNLDLKSLPDILFLDKLNDYLKEFITYGGYPRVVLEKDKEKKKFLLRNLFLTYIEKDITKLYGIKVKQKILDLIKHLASVNGGILNYNEAGSLTNHYYKEVKGIISILEDTYIVKKILPFHKNLTTELKKNPKVYFLDTGLRNFIVDRFDFSNEEFGILLENYILNLFEGYKIKYWRTTAKAEVDFILEHKSKLIPIEVKQIPKITKSFRSFINNYNPKKALIINLKQTEKQKINNTEIFTIPAGLI